MRKHEAQMKHIVTMALMLNLGVAAVYAQQHRPHGRGGPFCRELHVVAAGVVVGGSLSEGVRGKG